MRTPIAIFCCFLVACAQQPSAAARILVKGATMRALVETLDGLETTVARKVESLGGFTTASDLNGTGSESISRPRAIASSRSSKRPPTSMTRSR